MTHPVQTAAINLQTLCVPCACHCRYCLLSWDRRVIGADYERSKRYAEKFCRYVHENRPEIRFDFTFGYCMEHPGLPDELDFLNAVGSVQGQLLQLGGMRFRTPEQSAEFADMLFSHGVKRVHFTFYGLEEYHDRFAARPGDFANLLTMEQAAAASGLDISAGIPITSENAGQAGELLALLEDKGIRQTFLFIPHEEGRGASLSPVRFSEADLEKLGTKAAQKLNRGAFRPEREWVGGTWPEETNRLLIISLTPENIGQFETMDFEQVIRSVESLDDAYYAALPSFRELCEIYGDPSGTRFYGKRDLFRCYQKRFIAEHNLRLYDVTDERFCGSRRY